MLGIIEEKLEYEPISLHQLNDPKQEEYLEIPHHLCLYNSNKQHCAASTI
jgi:hypothetical protein